MKAKTIHEMMRFREESDPVHDMGIGMKKAIRDWIDKEITKGSAVRNVLDEDMLLYSAAHGKVEFVKYLIDQGYDVNLDNGVILGYASANGHEKIVKMLLKAGANVKAGDNIALRRASANNHTNIIKILIDAGANVQVANNLPLKKAVDFANDELVKILLDAGAYPNTKDAEGYNVINFAAKQGNTKIVKYLIDAGANVNTNNEYPLRYACWNGHIEIIKMLLDAGADANVNDGMLIKSLSKRNESKDAEVVKILKNHIAKQQKRE